MALIHCPYCGHNVSTTAERCPSCGAPVTPEAPKPVATQPVFAEQTPTPPPADNNEPDFGEAEDHTVRNILLFAVVLVLVVAFGFYCYQHSKSQFSQDDTEFTYNDSTATDSVMAVDTMSADTDEVEPEETLEISSQESDGSRQLLATYRYGDLQRSYYWDGNFSESGQLSIYDENGTCLKKHNLSEKYSISWMDSHDGIVAKLYNHHVYFVGVGGGASTAYCTVFYLTPLEGNGIHKIGSADGDVNAYEFLENSVRLRHLTCTNVETAESRIDYEYETSWETIPLR